MGTSYFKAVHTQHTAINFLVSNLQTVDMARKHVSKVIFFLCGVKYFVDLIEGRRICCCCCVPTCCAPTWFECTVLSEYKVKHFRLEK